MLGYCIQDKRKDSCLECMPLEKAIAQGVICKICCGKSTRNGICKSCSVSLKSSTRHQIRYFGFSVWKLHAIKKKTPLINPYTSPNCCQILTFII